MTKKTRVHGHGTRHVHIPRNYCFACGQDNPDGMHLKFHYEPRRKRFLCRFRLGRKYTGPPAHAHGGVIATILDEAMGKVNKLRHVIAMTSKMEVEYLKPVPLRRPLRRLARVAAERPQSGSGGARGSVRTAPIGASACAAKQAPRHEAASPVQ